MKYLWLIFFATVFYENILGQDSLQANKFSPAVNFSIGFLPKTYPIAPESPACAVGSAEFFWKFSGKDLWHQYYNYPRGGFELLYANLGNAKELGSAIGIIPALEWQTKNARSKWRFKMGFGIGYFNKLFDPITNQKNYYIGTHVVNMSRFSIARQTPMNDRLLLSYGFSAIHSSDGHTALPNVGLNVVTADVVLKFVYAQENRRTESKIEKQTNFYTFKFGVGMHELGETEKPVGGPSYPSYHLSAWYNRSFKHIHVLQIGMIAGYYTSFHDYITNHEVYSSQQNLKSSTVIIFTGHEFVFGKFGLSTQAGVYAYNPFYKKQARLEGNWNNTADKLESFITNRLGLNYYPFKKHNTLNKLKNQLGLSVFIKTNLAQADLFEYALSYTF